MTADITGHSIDPSRFVDDDIETASAQLDALGDFLRQIAEAYGDMPQANAFHCIAYSVEHAKETLDAGISRMAARALGKAA